MANKPDKFGLKFFLAVDLETKYVCNGLPYLGKYGDRPEDESISCHVVKTLVKPFANRGHNVTADNFFSSLETVRYLQQKSTSYVGTITANRREIP